MTQEHPTFHQRAVDLGTAIDAPVAVKARLGVDGWLMLCEYIQDHRQEFVDGLVAGGVLRSETAQVDYGDFALVYRVRKSCEHMWRIHGMTEDYLRRFVTIGCAECGETREVSSRLPVEVPS